jgi:2-polyprenyl-3-methyl-5-hydroxy-6-metoxy-1,4-benzoquinol methylase
VRPEVILETIPCPIGCIPRDALVLSAVDRLHGLPGRFTVVRCQVCGLMRTTPRPSQQTIRYYYPAEYAPHQPVESPPEARRGTFDGAWKRRLRSWAHHNSWNVPPIEPGSLMEIGCGSGAFLRDMAVRGWHVTGLELSDRAAALTRAQGFPVITGPVEQAVVPPQSFDMIVGWMVVEHLHDPIRALAHVRTWSRPGGWLAISVPDAGAVEFRIFQEAWYALMLPTHLFHFTAATIRRVLDQAGWTVQQVFWHNNPNNLIQSLRYVCSDRGWTRSANVLLDIAEGRRFRHAHMLAGKLLGSLHASGRMTVWARRA